MNDTLMHEIVVRFRGGASIRRIAQSLHISRRTVKRMLDRIERARVPTRRQPSQARPRRAVSSTLDQDAITDLLARYPDITTQRIHEELLPLGYQGSYSLLCSRVRTCVLGLSLRLCSGSRPHRVSTGADGLLHLRHRLHDRGTVPGFTPSATSWATLSGSISISSNARISPPRCASTSALSNT